MLREGIVDEIVDWMRREAEKRDCAGGVFGLSGGVDSAAAAQLAVRAFGDDALGVMLPASGSSGEDEEYARLAASACDLDTITLDLTEANNFLQTTFSKLDIEKVEQEYYPQTALKNAGGSDLSSQNIQTRLRMMALYYVAESKNYLVVGPTNKSEILTGYVTLYGDAGSDLRPLGDLLKIEVWELAERLGVPREIIERPPTGAMDSGEDRVTDEEEFGLDYETFDRIYLALEQGGDLSRFDADDLNRAVEIIAGARNKLQVPTFSLKSS